MPTGYIKRTLREVPPGSELITDVALVASIKLDSDIADALSKKHSNSLDHSNSSDHSNASDHSVNDVGTHGTTTTGVHGVGGGTIAKTSDITATAVGLNNCDNTSDVNKPVSTAQQTAITNINNNASYRTVKYGAGSHTAAKVAGNYVFPPAGGVMAVGGTGTLYPQQVFYLTTTDFPTINGIGTKLRVCGSVHCNDVAPFTGTFTFGLHPITRPATSGGAGVCIYTIGTVVSGSNGAVVTNAAADSSNNAIGSDFAIPVSGWYALVCVTTGTMATSSHVHLACELQMRNT